MTSSRPTLSLCMIVRNEAAMLPDCLASAAGLPAEIIVVDTGSTDGTQGIAAARGAVVIERPWRDDFSEARNASLAAATGDWILWLDADERLRRPEHDRVRACLRNEGFDAYLVNILSPRPAGPLVTRGHRLFRRRDDVRFTGRIHEQIGPALDRAGRRTAIADFVIDHLGYNLDREGQDAKDRRNLRLLVRAQEEHPRDAYVRFTLAQCLMSRSEYAAAERELKAALGEIAAQRMDKPLPADIRASAYSNLASIALMRGAAAECLARARQSLDARPEQVMAHVLIYQACRAMGQWKEALAALQLAERFLAEPPRHGGAAIEPTLNLSDVRRSLGQCCMALGRADEARRYFESALSEKPDDAATLAALARCEAGAGRLDVASALAERAHALAPDDEALLDLLVLLSLKQGRFAQAADRLGALCVRRPGDALLKRRLAGVLVKAGRPADAAKALAAERCR